MDGKVLESYSKDMKSKFKELKLEYKIILVATLAILIGVMGNVLAWLGFFAVIGVLIKIYLDRRKKNEKA